MRRARSVNLGRRQRQMRLCFCTDASDYHQLRVLSRNQQLIRLDFEEGFEGLIRSRCTSGLIRR